MSILKKCHFVNLDNGYRCGCLRCTLRNDDDLCKGCGHNQSFHESEDDNYLQKLLLNEVLSNRNLQLIPLICALNKSNQYMHPVAEQQNFESLDFEHHVNQNIQSNESFQSVHPSIPEQSFSLEN